MERALGNRSSVRTLKSPYVILGLSFCAFAALFCYYTFNVNGVSSHPVDWNTLITKKEVLDKEKLSRALGTAIASNQFPTELEIPGNASRGIVQYAFDPTLQETMQGLFQTYRPDYGAFVALDAETGQVLSMVSYSDHPSVKDNLAVRATFPSASVFKVVTAAAAIENRKLSPDSVIPFNGANHTLYRKNIVQTSYNRWTRHMTLKEAFAKSVNTIFGRIGAFSVGPVEMKEYADRFGFNRPIPADVPVQPGKAPIPTDAWGLAETASGYTRDNTMSPMQGALIAAAVVNGGVMMEPYLVHSVYAQDGTEVYKAKPKVGTVVIDPQTAGEIRTLMRETVTRGTSKKSFRGFFRGDLKSIDVGGKTGSLTGTDPQGKYDWFVGYAEGKQRKIAFAALTVHQKLWRVKSSYLTRLAIEKQFK